MLHKVLSIRSDGLISVYHFWLIWTYWKTFISDLKNQYKYKCRGSNIWMLSHICVKTYLLIHSLARPSISKVHQIDTWVKLRKLQNISGDKTVSVMQDRNRSWYGSSRLWLIGRPNNLKVRGNRTVSWRIDEISRYRTVPRRFWYLLIVNQDKF